MSKSRRRDFPNFRNSPAPKIEPIRDGSFLDLMVDGREYQSIVGSPGIKVDLGAEMKRALSDISAIRQRPIICYLANMLNPTVTSNSSISIDNSDDTPFIEMLKAVPTEYRCVDIILVTPGGLADTVDYYVKKLRERFDSIGFILPYMAMSAGTIFCLSGDELIMEESAFIGPIDPQVPSRNGMLVPAQSLMTLISTIKARGEDQIKKGKQPDWTDILILKNLDPKELGNAITASALSTKLVTDYLFKYKFRDWKEHSAGGIVTEEERQGRAKEIANILCNNALWLSHGSRITREIAVNTCKLRITYPETIEGLDRAIRRFWALMRFTFENNPISKVYATGDYFLFRGIKLNQANGTKPK